HAVSFGASRVAERVLDEEPRRSADGALTVGVLAAVLAIFHDAPARHALDWLELLAEHVAAVAVEHPLHHVVAPVVDVVDRVIVRPCVSHAAQGFDKFRQRYPCSHTSFSTSASADAIA